MRVIIMCAGLGTRWSGTVPKHLVDVGGEVLLHRTVRMLLERGVDDVWIASDDARYDAEGATRFSPLAHPYDVDKFYSARDVWAPDTRHLYGDVFYTDAAMDRIALDAPGPRYRIYGRRHRSRITGTRHGECFAFCFFDLDHCRRGCEQLRGMDEAGALRRSGSWELYQILQGRPPNPYGRQHFDEHWVEIDDWTEDFDSVDEYEEWTRRRRSAGL